MDILGIVRHEMNAEELLTLPQMIDSWNDVKELKNDKNQSNIKASWDCKSPPTEKALIEIWNCDEKNIGRHRHLDEYNNWIDCFIGDIHIYRKTLIISHFPEHKYGNIQHPEIAKKIIGVNRKVAQYLGGEEIIYFADSYYPTAIIQEYVTEGKSFTEIKNLAINEFGNPPKGIEKGRKYMFFIDNINEEIGEISEWDDYEGYWKYNESIGEYELKKEDSM